jgi:hypothetical protein
MSRRTSLIFLALLIPAALSSQTASKNMAVGTWKLNTPKSKFDPGPGPKSATVVIGEDNKIQYSEETADAKSTSWSVLPTADGTPAPIVGMGENSTLVEKRIDGRHVEHTWKVGSGTETGKSVLSKNGKTMTYTLTGTDPDGKAVHNVEIFEKQ